MDNNRNDCPNCEFYKVADTECTKGIDAEMYCMGGGYELFEPSDDLLAKEKIIKEDMQQKQNDLRDSKNVSAEEYDLISKINNGTLKLEDISEDEMEKLSEHAQQLIEDIQQATDRPTNTDQGFNGVFKDKGSKSNTCFGCIHHSNIGCFLNKFKDCSLNEYYLYNAEDPDKTTKKSPEVIEDEKEEIEFIDKELINNPINPDEVKRETVSGSKPMDLKLDDDFINDILKEADDFGK